MRRKPINSPREAKVFLALISLSLFLEWLHVRNPFSKWYLRKEFCKYLLCSHTTAERKEFTYLVDIISISSFRGILVGVNKETINKNLNYKRVYLLCFHF